MGSIWGRPKRFFETQILDRLEKKDERPPNTLVTHLLNTF